MIGQIISFFELLIIGLGFFSSLGIGFKLIRITELINVTDYFLFILFLLILNLLYHLFVLFCLNIFVLVSWLSNIYFSYKILIL